MSNHTVLIYLDVVGIKRIQALEHPTGIWILYLILPDCVNINKLLNYQCVFFLICKTKVVETLSYKVIIKLNELIHKKYNSF